MHHTGVRNPVHQQLQDNPVRVARHHIHRTIAEAAEGAGIHWQAWYLTEVGCYERVSERIEQYLRFKGYSGPLLAEGYNVYRRSKQRVYGDSHSDVFQILPCVDTSKSPLSFYWEKIGVSRTSFAKSLAIQPAHLYRLSKGNCKELPESVVEALQNAGMPRSIIEELNERQTEFYERL